MLMVLACHKSDPAALPSIFSGVKTMRTNRPNAFYRLSALLAGFVACAWSGIAASRAAEDQRPVSVQLSFDRPLDAGMAPFVLAADRGLFGAEGLSVRMTLANGSPEAIARVASGESNGRIVLPQDTSIAAFALNDESFVAERVGGRRKSSVVRVIIAFREDHVRGICVGNLEYFQRGSGSAHCYSSGRPSGVRYRSIRSRTVQELLTVVLVPLRANT